MLQLHLPLTLQLTQSGPSSPSGQNKGPSHVGRGRSQTSGGRTQERLLVLPGQTRPGKSPHLSAATRSECGRQRHCEAQTLVCLQGPCHRLSQAQEGWKGSVRRNEMLLLPSSTCRDQTLTPAFSRCAPVECG